MGMGYGAAYGDVIEEKSIQDLCPNEWDALQKAMVDAEIELYDFYMADREGEVIPSEVQRAFDNLRVAFQNTTKLALCLNYHNSDDDGSRYDDVDGTFWEVEGMYQLSSAGEKMKNMVSRKFWVIFG